MSRALDAVNLVSNLAIVVGYILVPATWLAYLPLTLTVRLAGIGFFTTCAITHLSMAFGFAHTPPMVLNHAVQAVFVIWFVLSFWRLLRAAHRTRMERLGLNPHTDPKAATPAPALGDGDGPC